jgi:hypothetical protein
VIKLIFIPFSVAAGLVSGLASKRVFNALWGVVDDEQPPRPEHRRISVAKLALALGLEGAVFRLVKGLVDHGSREGFSRLTGRWPGEEAPQPE